jgi:hypothetical protein
MAVKGTLPNAAAKERKQAQTVAQASSLPYRRLPVGRLLERASTPFRSQRQAGWKPAIQQTGKSALRGLPLRRCVAFSRCQSFPSTQLVLAISFKIPYFSFRKRFMSSNLGFSAGDQSSLQIWSNTPNLQGCCSESTLAKMNQLLRTLHDALEIPEKRVATKSQNGTKSSFSWLFAPFCVN